ncbi:hypothetical protein C8J57DRAFT_1212502 [Mycena rebaudengoi]|nr:hypothetical protein C8J57DRAFT_1212502 [Mycena rebaudengoi]
MGPRTLPRRAIAQIPSSSTSGLRVPFTLLIFAGPRICLGQQFAYHEPSFFLVLQAACPQNALRTTRWGGKRARKVGYGESEKSTPGAYGSLYLNGGRSMIGLQRIFTEFYWAELKRPEGGNLDNSVW